MTGAKETQYDLDIRQFGTGFRLNGIQQKRDTISLEDTRSGLNLRGH